MTKFTKERLERYIKSPLEHGLTRSEQMEMARQLLAGLEQEPVAYMQIDGDDVEYNGHNEFSGGGKGIPLYAAPQLPQPAVDDIGEISVGRLPTMNQDEYPGLGDWWVQLRIGEGSDEVLARVYGATPQEANSRAEALACRAAMLQGADASLNNEGYIADNAKMITDSRGMITDNTEPVSQPYTLPDGWVAVPVDPTEKMVIEGFESVPHPLFQPADWDKYQTMSGCEQAAHRAKLCWAAMVKAAPRKL